MSSHVVLTGDSNSLLAAFEAVEHELEGVTRNLRLCVAELGAASRENSQLSSMNSSLNKENNELRAQVERLECLVNSTFDYSNANKRLESALASEQSAKVAAETAAAAHRHTVEQLELTQSTITVRHERETSEYRDEINSLQQCLSTEKTKVAQLEQKLDESVATAAKLRKELSTREQKWRLKDQQNQMKLANQLRQAGEYRGTSTKKRGGHRSVRVESSEVRGENRGDRGSPGGQSRYDSTASAAHTAEIGTRSSHRGEGGRDAVGRTAEPGAVGGGRSAVGSDAVGELHKGVGIGVGGDRAGGRGETSSKGRAQVRKRKRFRNALGSIQFDM